MSLSPMQAYTQKLKTGGMVPDDAQYAALKELDRIYLELLAARQVKQHLFFKFYKVKPVRGLYMHGGVGRGKTLLMDIFYACLPGADKMRMHFYRFMSMVHEKLNALQHERDPLRLVADAIAEQASVICFDEFIVEDIGDAMILGLLFKFLFQKGVCIIATSNIEPEHLYEGGIQRDRFLPAIGQIKKHMTILNVDSGQDYRLDVLQSTARYFTPLNGQRDFMQAQFDSLVPEGADGQTLLKIRNRKVHCIAHSDKVVWFEFEALCQSPRSAEDYIELADHYEVVLVSNVLQLTGSMDDYARRFVALIDELYDRQIQLILSAQVPIADLYKGSRLSAIFERTKSRLVEMQKV